MPPRTLHLVLASLVLFAGGMPTSNATPAAQNSAAGLAWPLPDQPGLPPAVARTRQEIAKAAIAGDYRRLRELGAKAGEFSYHYHYDSGDPLLYWQQEEHSGEPIFAIMVKTLMLPNAFDAANQEFTWPALEGAHGETRLAGAPWSALIPIYGAERAKEIEQSGFFPAYVHYIAPDGRWSGFIIPD